MGSCASAGPASPPSGHTDGSSISIPSFKAWYAEHAQENGEFEMELPSVWPLGGDAGPAEAQDPTPEG